MASEAAERYAREDLGMADDEPNAATGISTRMSFMETAHHFDAGVQSVLNGLDRDVIAQTLIRASRELHGEFGACVDEVDSPALADAVLAAIKAQHSTGDGETREEFVDPEPWVVQVPPLPPSRRAGPTHQSFAHEYYEPRTRAQWMEDQR